MQLIELYRSIKRYYLDVNRSKHSTIKLFNAQILTPNNYTLHDNVNNHWLIKFIKNNNLVKKSNTISIFGVNGDKTSIFFDASKIKIFYTIENVHVKESPWTKYQDLLLNDPRISISLGFDYIKNPKYIRFPYWLMTLFEPKIDYKSIKSTCDNINFAFKSDRRRHQFCAFICKKDYFGDRAFFSDLIAGHINEINYGGDFRNNDNDLKLVFNNDKISYLKQFRFNLCPENSDSDGYVTEKIFDSFMAGCIPIYWGSNNKPEENIINPNTFFCIDRVNIGKNIQVLNEIRRLENHPNELKLFRKQDPLNKEAPDIIYNKFITLKNKIEILLE